MKKVSVASYGSTKEVKKMNADLEEALEIAGAGKYQICHCLLMVMALTASLMEVLSYSFVLPTAACDLQVPVHLRGLITSIPNIGIILTAAFWGRMADNYGRKPILLLACMAAGLFCFIAAFMPNLVSFAICKFFASLFLSVPSSLSFAYAGEITPTRRRDLAVLCVNGLLTVSSALSPLIAWAVLSIDWRVNLGAINFRPWRLLTIVYALLLVLTSISVIFIKESPKFLVSKGKYREALEVLRYIYSKNSGRPQDDYYVRIQIITIYLLLRRLKFLSTNAC
ncbi:synaptic vesicle glycoprotein 2C-like [Hyposmocoma kahamanoa]|uniref:synaptic vesicle glycoprotein 2C-like n=1 Tax=Hyposmocoma kahamanoa TaxID=1477025 RepID=UPI000E6D64C2|nr:synaptic vesicle glycoprotein 2C-like [Hyposmocoma kahamanoa]